MTPRGNDRERRLVSLSLSRIRQAILSLSSSRARTRDPIKPRLSVLEEISIINDIDSSYSRRVAGVTRSAPRPLVARAWKSRVLAVRGTIAERSLRLSYLVRFLRQLIGSVTVAA